MRLFIVLLIIFLSASDSTKARPNFVFFLADDVSAEDIGCYGHPSIQTPNIDRLAGMGMRFENAILTTSSCSPSRCSMITGRFPHNTGAPELHTPLPKGQPLFPKLLKDAGYYTVLSGKDHMGPNAHPAFDLVSKGKDPGKEGDWVEITQKRPMDKPFFFWFASSDAHRNWQITEHAPHYNPEQMVVPPYLVDGPKTRKDLTGYAHEVSRFDHFIGRVVEELEKQGVLENTVIIITADNGRPFPRCKTRLYDSGIKPPFVVWNPKRVKTGITESLVSSIDISASILDLAGVEKDERIQGVSFVPILNNPKAVTRNVAFSEHNWHVYKNHERSVRFGDWLYIKNDYPHQQNLCMEARNAELEQGFKAGTLSDAQMNIFWNPCPEEELYQLSKDPHQLTNLAKNPEYFQTLEKARTLLAEWTEQTGDTLPLDPTRDRNDRPDGTKGEGREKHRHREMPGDATEAWKINAPGPVKF